VPQFFPVDSQVFGAQTLHRFALQISLVLHVPHVSLLPHPSSSVPQFFPADSHVFGAQALHRFALQISLVLHVPHVSLLPHPSSSVPQFFPADSHVFGVHVTHWLPWHSLPVGQPPQSTVVPALQLSGILPHSTLARLHAWGWGTVTVGQEHLSVPPQPSDSVPHTPVG
jgi:hypothetical protein